MSSHRPSSRTPSGDILADIVESTQNSAGYVTQSGKSPRYIKQYFEAFEEDLDAENEEQSELSIHSGVTYFSMDVDIESDDGRSEISYNSDLTHVLGDASLRSNGRVQRAGGDAKSADSSENMKQGFEAKLEGATTHKMHGGKRLPTPQTSIESPVASGKRLPSIPTPVQRPLHSTTSRKNLAGLTTHGSHSTPSVIPLPTLTYPALGTVAPPTNSQEPAIARLTAGLVPRPISNKHTPPIPGSVKESHIPRMDAHWSVRTMQGKSSRAGAEELLRKFGEDPRDPRLSGLNTKELYEYTGVMQQRCRAIKIVVKQAAEKALDSSALRPLLVLEEIIVSDDDNVAGTFSEDQQTGAAIISAKRTREDVSDGEGDEPVVPRPTKRVKTQPSAKAKGKQPVKLAEKSEHASAAANQPTAKLLADVTDALKAIKNITLKDISQADQSDLSNHTADMGDYKVGEYEAMLILFDPQGNPLLSLQAQRLVRPIVHRRSEIVEVYQRWRELEHGTPTMEKSPYLFYHLRLFRTELERLMDEVVGLVGAGGEEEVRMVINEVFARDIEHGQI
jgi:hypothetical protein